MKEQENMFYNRCRFWIFE